MTEYIVYGFPVPESRLVNRGYRVALSQGKRPSAVPSENVRTAFDDIRRKTGDLHARLVLAYYAQDIPTSLERDYAIALASNDNTDGLPNVPPPAESIEKLKVVLGVKPDEAPTWYYADRTPEDVPRRL
ncbi:hypothetical protein NM688_g3102 [Phlebia brevispora]|uniref:Uncharacterized protein n=1 Tax=Phlebia brevispora TaxID=194682 RepID=A0ACC1T6M1_9APHY|nr:hypothetical protein NM688_g3102 [Phlebia brevispora]